MGRIALQSVVDAFCSLALAKPYLSKLPMTAVDLLNDRLLPFYKERGVPVEHILTDNGREFCGQPLHYSYELFVAIHQITHQNTKVHPPYTNVFCERFHRTVSDDFFNAALRKTLYLSLAQLQAHLDTWFETYNMPPPHQGYRTKDRIPLKPFQDGLAERREDVAPAT